MAKAAAHPHRFTIAGTVAKAHGEGHAGMWLDVALKHQPRSTVVGVKGGTLCPRPYSRYLLATISGIRPEGLIAFLKNCLIQVRRGSGLLFSLR
ncbi:MAG: hypothetical protein H7240_07155 [Glaciimonas sp.]|nr:hypothetical protein [Glaciimonas sp.]